MDQQNPGSGSSNPSIVPMKRKRGRPRKEESSAGRGRAAPISAALPIPAIAALPIPVTIAAPSSASQSDNTPGSDNIVNPGQTEGSTGGADEAMLGRPVTGVIEGTFGGGYLVNVKIADTQTSLKGAVFVEGQYIPVTPENDVAPHVKMVERKNFPIPILNPQGQLQSPIPSSSGQGSNQPVESIPPVPKFQEQAPPTETHSGTSLSLENQPTSVEVPMANIPKNDSTISAAGIPQVLPEPGHVSQPAEMECDKIVEQDDVVLPKDDASGQVKEHSTDGGEEKGLEPTPEAENKEKEPLTEVQAGSSDSKLNEQIPGEPKNSNTIQTDEPESKQSEQIQDETKESNVELNQLPATEPEPMQTDEVHDEPDKSDINVLPVSAEPEAEQSELTNDEPKNPGIELNQIPESAESEPMHSEKIPDEPEKSDIELNQMPPSIEPETKQSEQDSPKPALETSKPSESEAASEGGSNLPGISDPQAETHGLSGDITKEDDTLPGESSVKPVEPENPVGPDNI